MTADTAPLDLGGGIRIHPGIMLPELVPADTIQPHPRNPRRGDEAAIGESLDTNGLYDQVKVQRSTGFILSGNHTYKTLVSKGAERVPVVWLDVDDAEAARVMTSANATADRGTYDTQLLVSILADELHGDLEGSGYYEEDMAVLLRAAEAEEVFLDGLGAKHMLDEFKKLSGQEETDFQRRYHAKITVYLRDSDALTGFSEALGTSDMKDGDTLDYPLGWSRSDGD